MRREILNISIVIIFISLLLYSWSNRLDPLESFSLRFHDNNFELHHRTPHKDIVFIAIDEQSVNHLGRWPWNRDLLSDGLESLQKSKIVLLDMIFSEKTENDEKLKERLSLLPNSVCGFFLRQRATQTISDYQKEMLTDSSLDHLQMSLHNQHSKRFVEAKFAEVNIEPLLESCNMSGTFSTLRDKDQLFRSYPLAFYYDNYLYPSLGVQALRLYKNEDIKYSDNNSVTLADKTFYHDEKGFVKLNYYPLSMYKTISFLDLYEKKVSENYFKNKIVIVGITDVGAGDVRATPMGAMNGPLLHYTFISNYLNSELVHELRGVGAVSIVLFGLLALFLSFVFRKVLFRVSSYIAIYLLFFTVSKLLFVYYSYYIDAFYPFIALIISALFIEIQSFIYKEKEGQFIENAFSNYLSSELLTELKQNPEQLKLGGEKKEMSILFSDIRSFTTFSEKLSPQQLISLMNRYFTPMTQAVIDNGGMLDKYIGDAVMAFYNAPLDLKEHANASCETALKMIEELKILNKALEKENLPFIDIGIGINSDEVIVGNMGSAQRFNYTVVGDGVNLASRVEGLNKEYGTNILITEYTKLKISSHYLTRKLEKVKIKGKQNGVIIFELMENTTLNQKLKEKFDKAIVVYENKRYEDAIIAFEDICKTRDDKVSRVFIKKAKEIIDEKCSRVSCRTN
jgi:adenylate cyclase